MTEHDQTTRCLAGDDLDAWLASFEDTKAALIEANQEIDRLRDLLRRVIDDEDPGHFDGATAEALAYLETLDG